MASRRHADTVGNGFDTSGVACIGAGSIIRLGRHRVQRMCEGCTQDADGWLGQAMTSLSTSDSASTISAYYYSPVRSVFVGVLVGAAFSLVAIRGRRGAENALLDLAGMLLPLVAIVPTPVEGTSDAPCLRGVRYIPEEFLAGVEVGVAALLILGAVGLVFGGWSTAWLRGAWRSFSSPPGVDTTPRSSGWKPGC